MALAAVRYCLGRSSYIVGDCCDWLCVVWDSLAPNARACIQRDVEAAVERDDEARLSPGRYHLPLGDDCDRKQWLRVRALWGA